MNHLSFTISNCFKRLVIVTSGMIYFGNLTWQAFIGMLIAVLGILWYHLAKNSDTESHTLGLDTKSKLEEEEKVEDVAESENI